MCKLALAGKLNPGILDQAAAALPLSYDLQFSACPGGIFQFIWNWRKQPCIGEAVGINLSLPLVLQLKCIMDYLVPSLSPVPLLLEHRGAEETLGNEGIMWTHLLMLASPLIWCVPDCLWNVVDNLLVLTLPLTAHLTELKTSWAVRLTFLCIEAIFRINILNFAT